MIQQLGRFLEAQDYCYDQALSEIKAGIKQSHWIWYVFPQMKGLGHSYNSNYYGISGLEEASAYLNHPVLGARLREATVSILSLNGLDIDEIMPRIDAIKLRSSMTLFDAVSPNDVFADVLQKYYSSIRDNRTLQMIKSQD